MNAPDHSRNEKHAVGPLSPPPSAFTEEVVFTHLGGGAELRCTYEREGSMYAGGLQFERVRASRYRAEGHCTPWHIEDAYDTLVEVTDSAWVRELLDAEPRGAQGAWTIRHFLIFIDGSGAYEVAAESCAWLPEQPVG